MLILAFGTLAIGAPARAAAAAPPGTPPPPTAPANPEEPAGSVPTEPTTEPVAGTVAHADEVSVPPTTVAAERDPVRDVFEGLSDEQLDRIRSTVVAGRRLHAPRHEGA